MEKEEFELKLKKYKELVAEIKKHDELYYTKAEPIISDAEYDRLYFQLEVLESELPKEYLLEDSPTQHVGGEILEGLEKYTHNTPLLSIPFKEKDMTLVENWYNQVAGGEGTEIIIQPKCDGLTINVTYDNGKYINAATRGNGYIGENVTENVRTISKVVKEYSDDKILKMDVRGEAIIDYDRFKSLLQGENNYSNPRNAVSGIIRQLNTSIVKKQKPNIVFYDVVPYETEYKFTKDNEWVDKLNELGFLTAPYVIVNSFEDLKKVLDSKLNGIIKEIDGFNICCMDKLKFLCDGLVLKVNDINKRNDIGMVSKGPKWSLAYKFKSLQAHTRIDKVDWQVGRTGVVSPVAVFDEISLGGVKIKKSTLHNISYMENLLVMGEQRLNFDTLQHTYISYETMLSYENCTHYLKPDDILFDTQYEKSQGEKECRFVKIKSVDDDGFYISKPTLYQDEWYPMEKDRYYLVSAWLLENSIISQEYINESELKEEIEEIISNTKGLRFEDVITVERSNDVIPKIIDIHHRSNFVHTDDLETIMMIEEKEKTFNIPKKCPVCGSRLTNRYPLFYCDNFECSAKLKGSIAHFVSRDAMNIVGLGKEIINVLVDEGYIDSIESIYLLSLHKDKLINIDGFGEKKVDNLLKSIRKSKGAELYRFIYGLGIREVGLSTAKSLAKTYKHLDYLIQASHDINELQKIPDIGSVVAQNIHDFFNNPNTLDAIDDLMLNIILSPVEDNNVANPDALKGLTFVITGTLKEKRNYYKDIVESLGGKVSGSVSKKTHAVIIGEDSGSKETKARQLISEGHDIKLIIGHDEFIDYISKLEN